MAPSSNVQTVQRAILICPQLELKPGMLWWDVWQVSDKRLTYELLGLVSPSRRGELPGGPGGSCAPTGGRDCLVFMRRITATRSRTARAVRAVLETMEADTKPTVVAR